MGRELQERGLSWSLDGWNTVAQALNIEEVAKFEAHEIAGDDRWWTTERVVPVWLKQGGWISSWKQALRKLGGTL